MSAVNCPDSLSLLPTASAACISHATSSVRNASTSSNSSYRSYVRQLKKARAEGKLSDEEQRNAAKKIQGILPTDEHG